MRLELRPGPAAVVALLGLMCAAIPAARAASFYVAPDGADSNPGTLKQPFATLPRAQAAVRVSRGQGPVTVFLRGGTYYLAEPLVFTAEDSGAKAAPVVYRAYRQEQPVVSGGARLELKWEPYRDGIMKAPVPAGLTTDQLFVNGERQILARYPNFDPKERIWNGYAPDAFSPQRAAHWADPRGGFIHAMHRAMWGDFHYVITGKDAQNKVTYEGGWQNNRRMGMHDQFRMVENIFEELDAPREWFLDGKTATLYFYPPAGTDLAKATVEAVRLRHLVEFRGTAEEPVRFLTLRGLTFRHAARTFMDNKEPLMRSDWTIYRGGAVFLNGTEDCGLEDCFLDQLGGNAVFVNNYNRRVKVRGCHIANAGANGVAFVGDPNAVRSPLFEYGQVQPLEKIDRTPGPKSPNYPADCLVVDCLIYLSGRVEKQTAAVQIQMAQDITVRHCSLYDVPRAAVNIGDGCWGGHVIEFCDIFDTVKETGDHGSFNSWGRDRYWRPSINTVNAWVQQAPELPLLDVVKPVILRNNRWRCDHGWDIDLDDGSSNYEIRNNLCLNGGIKNREGFYRVVENNIMVNNSFNPHVWFTNSHDIFRRNIVYTPYVPIGMPKVWGTEIDYNLLHQPGALTPLPATRLQQQSGRDEHSLVGDALFVKVSAGDYRVKSGSPALKLGFRNFPMTGFGVQKASLRALARTPELPGPGQGPVAGSNTQRNARVVDWQGARIKNVTSLGEVSAAGLPGEVGIRLQEVPAQSAAAKAGLRENDIILKCNGHDVNTVGELQRACRGAAGPAVKLGVWRNQRLQEIEIRP